MRVLIAEDTAPARLVLQRAVENLGHECLTAADGDQAWELFQRESPQVIISDWLMPGLDGPELCRRVRAHRPIYTYFIYLTMLEDKQHVIDGMEAGADDYLTKPLDLDELKIRLIAAERVTALHQQIAMYDDEHASAGVLEQIARLGPRLSTSVLVNGRALVLDAAIRLVEQLPPDTRVSRRGVHIFLTPDPFGPESRVLDRAANKEGVVKRRTEYQENAELLTRLIEGVERDDVERDDSVKKQRWWHKLGGIVGSSK